MPNSKGSGSQRVGASGSSHVLRAERLKQRRSSGVLSKLLSVVLAINMALMFALPATIFADNPSNNAADDYVTAPSANDVLSEDPGSSGSTVGDATGQEVTIEQPSVSGDAAVSPTNDAASVTTLDGDESLDGGFGVLDVGDVDVSDWAGFLAAWRDPATVRILLTNDITHPGGTTAGNRLSNGFTRTTDIQVTSAAGGPFTIDFGADANAANSFVLGTATAATPHRFNLNNVIIAHAGAAYTNAVVYSGTTAVNAAGWTVAIGNVSSKADTAPSILAVQINRGFNVELSGTIKWKSTSPQYDVYARNITIANGSTLDLASGAAANIYPLGALEMVMVGSNVNLTLSGTAGINSSGIVAIANNTKVTFSTTTGGILASSFAVGAGSKLTFEAGTAAAGGIIAPSGIAIGPLTEVSIATGTLTSNGGAIVISDGATVTIDNGSIVSTSTSSSFTTGNYVTLSLTNPTGNGITLPTTGVPNTVTFGERNTVNITCLNYAVSARGLTIGKDTVANFSTSTTVSSATATINLRPQNADAARPAFLNILDGADVTVTANAANGIWLDSTVNKGEQTNSTSMTGARSDILVVNGAKLTVTGNGTGNGYRGAVCMLGVGGGITATNGSTISITATNAAAYPAALLQMRDGQFNVSGASTLAIKQLGSQDGYTATLRFRYGNGQSFNVSGGSTVTIERPAYTRGDSYKSAAIRFGDATGNSFNIIEGSKVKVYNGGTGTADTASGEPGGNEAIEIVNNDFSFTLSGAGSSCELVADLGAAVDANAHSGASITVGPGTAFLATGNTGNTTFAIFQCTGGNFNFTTTNPLYYDFQNTRAGGGRILGIGTSTTSTFKSTNSDVALWRGGVNAASGNPGASFTYISYALSGSALATVSADSDAAFRAYYLGGGTSAWYTRISGNNGLPEIPTTGAVVPTNADKYVRVLGTLAEGSQPARPFWDNEVWGEFEYTPLGGSPILYQSTNTNRNTVRSFNSEPVYLQETAANLPGVLRLDNNNNFLKPGDGYRLLRAWRSDNPDDTNRHESVYQLPISVVQDVTPPKPADIDFPQSGSFFYIGQNTISGTYPLAAAQDAWNAEPAVSGKLLLVNTANPAGVEITGSTVTLNPSGTWTATVPSTATLADGDKIHIVLSDTNGNTNPVVATKVHDAEFPAGDFITVRDFPISMTATDKIIGLDEARDILTATDDTNRGYTGTTFENLKKLIGATGTLNPGYPATDTGVSVTNASPTFNAAALDVIANSNPSTPQDFTITYASDYDSSFTKTANVRVMPYDVDGELIFGNHFTIPYENAKALLAKPLADRDAEFITRAGAVAYANGDDTTPLSAANVAVTSHTLPVDPVVGDYTVTFNIIGLPTETVTVTVHVVGGRIPVLIVNPDRVELNVGDPTPTDTDIRAGVTAYDAAAGTNITNQVTYAGSVDTSTEGIYTITYTVVNSDGNSVTATRLYFVGIKPVYDYAVSAHDFVKLVAPSNGSNAEILSYAGARAWDISDPYHIVEVPAVLAVKTTGGYPGTPKAAGDYSITIGVNAVAPNTGDPQVTINGKLLARDVISEGTNTAAPTDDKRYVVAANTPVPVTLAQATALGGALNASKNTELIARAGAVGFVIDDGAATPPRTSTHGVEVVSSAIPAVPTVNSEYPVVFRPAGTAGVEVTVLFKVDNGDWPVIVFLEEPLVIEYTDASHVLTPAELKAQASITDVQDDGTGGRSASYTKDNAVVIAYGATNTGRGPAIAAGINSHDVGVYIVGYSALDLDGNNTTAYRSVVVNDGRYIINGTLIIGARDYLVNRTGDGAVNGTESQARDLSYAEAYTIEGVKLPVSWTTAPVGYVANAAEGNYTINWTAAGYTGYKSITAHVIDADVIDPGGENSQYAIYASHFNRTTTAARAMLGAALEANLILAANVHVIKLVPFDSAGLPLPDRSPAVANNGGFAANAPNVNPGQYNVNFVIGGLTNNTQNVTVKGTVSDDPGPTLTVTTPIAVAQNAAFDPLAGVIATDAEDDGTGGRSVNYTITQVQVTREGVAYVLNPIDTAVPGVYRLHYSVTDLGGTTVERDRAVVVNDGSYVLSTTQGGRVLKATSFVVRASDVTNDGTDAGLKTDIISKAGVVVYNGTTAEIVPNTIVEVTALANYHKQAGTYEPIVISAEDFPSGTITRSIRGKVVDAEIIEQGPNPPIVGNNDLYFIYGNNGNMLVSDAQNFITAAGGTDTLVRAAILNHLKVHADKVTPVGVISDANAKIVSITGPAGLTEFSSVQGDYYIAVASAGNEVSTTLKINVSIGDAPILHYPGEPGTSQPLNLELGAIPASSIDSNGNLTREALLDPNPTNPLQPYRIYATDTEDDADPNDNKETHIVINPTTSNVEQLPAIPANVKGVYTVTYRAIDSDGNIDTETRAIIINDGSITHDDEFILQARSFVLRLGEYNFSTPLAQIIEKSNAQVWTIDGVLVPGRAYVSDLGAYSANKGTYTNIKIGVSGHVGLEKTVSARIVNDGIPPLTNVGDENALNGDEYAAYVVNARINRTHAVTLQVGTDAALESDLITRTGALSYLRTGSTLIANGTPRLVSITKQGAPAVNFKTAGTLANGDIFIAVFKTDEEPATIIEAKIFISDANPPSLDVPGLRAVGLNAPFGDAQYRDGVTANDPEDQDITANVKYGTITAGSNGILGDNDDIFTERTDIVDTSVENARYQVDYWVTDSDFNTTRGSGLILVGPWELEDGYAVNAQSFVIGAPNFTALYGSQTYLAGTDDFILEASQAEGLRFNTATNSVSAVATLVLEAALYKAQGPLVTEALYPNGRDFTLRIGVENSSNPGHPYKEITVKVVGKPVEPGAYSVGANTPIVLSTTQAASVGGALNATKKAQLIQWADAQAWDATGSSILDWEVDVQSSQIPTNPSVGGDYEVVFIAKDHPEAHFTTHFVISSAGTNPVIIFQEEPLIITQTPGQSHVLTQTELKARLVATDAQDDGTGGRAANYTFTNTVATVAGGITIDTQNVGVYKVTYSVTDLDNLTTTATRAVIVTDGRYIIDTNEGIIIGGRDFVARHTAITGTEVEARAMAYVEAYDIGGDRIADSDVRWAGAPVGTNTGSPYIAQPEADTYAFSWAVAGHATPIKAVTGTITKADVVIPGGKDSQYSLVAWHFTKSSLEATAMLTPDVSAALITASRAEVIKLVAVDASGNPVPDRAPYVVDKGGFDAVSPVLENAAGYPIGIGIVGIAPADIQADIKAYVSDGDAPWIEIAAPKALEIPAGGAFTPALALTGVTAGDAEDDLANGAGYTLSRVTYAPVAGSSAVDTNAPGIYKYAYDVTDSAGNAAQTKYRTIVVNDGSYVVGQGRVLQANGFVAKSTDVPAAAADKDTQILSLSGAQLYDAETGGLISAISVANRGGYSATAAEYDITITGVDYPAGTIDKNIVGKVVGADVVEEGPEPPDVYDRTRYFVYGNNIVLTISEAQDIVDAAAGNSAALNSGIITALDAHAVSVAPDNTVADANAKVVSITKNGVITPFSSAVGIYTVTVADSLNKKEIALTISVGSGKLPELHFNPNPLSLDKDTIPTSSVDGSGNLTNAAILYGVTATDEEDDADPNDNKVTTISIVSIEKDGQVVTSIPANAVAVYKVTYKATDSDGGEVVKPRALAINDGSITVTPDYLLKARSFVIHANDVAAGGAVAAQILTESEARAWRSDGSAAIAEVRSEGGYKAVAGDWKPQIGIYGDTTLTRTITARVTEEPIIVNGELYTLTARNFTINLLDAQALAAQSDAAAYSSTFVARASAHSYLRADVNLGLAGTPELAAPVVKVGTGTDFKTATTFIDGDKYRATFWVSEEHDTSVTVEVTVSNRTAPSLYVPPFKSVALNDTWGDAQYREGVTVADAEEPLLTVADVKYGTITAGSDGILGNADDNFTEGTPVNTAVEGAYEIDYWVTDSDNNTVRGKSLVLVSGSGIWIVKGYYAIAAVDFVTTVDEFNPATTPLVPAAGTDEYIIGSSFAIVKILDPVTKTYVNGTPLVLDRGSYAAAAGDYSIALTPELTIPQPNGESLPEVTVKAKVINKDVIDVGPKTPLDSGSATKYVLAANNVQGLSLDTLKALSGESDAVKAELIQRAQAQSFLIVGANAATSLLPWEVEVKAGGNGIPANPVAQTPYSVTFVPKTPGSGVEITVTFSSTDVTRYRVGFDANGGVLRGPSAIYVVEPATTLAYLPDAPVRQDYTFAGWNTAANGAGAGFNAATPVTADITVYAQWIRNAVTPPQNVIVYPPSVYVGSGTTTTVPPDTSTEPPTYITVQPNDDLTSLADDTTPLGDSDDTPAEETTWSGFNLGCAILSLLLFVAFIAKFFVDRKRRDEDEYYARQPKKSALYVNLPVLLVGVIALVETAVLLFTTQDFAAAAKSFDQFSVVFALIVFVLLFAPMVAAALETHSNIRRSNLPAAKQAPAQPAASTPQPPARSVTL